MWLLYYENAKYDYTGVHSNGEQTGSVMHISEVEINSEDQNRENNLSTLASFERKNIQEESWSCVSVKDHTSRKTP